MLLLHMFAEKTCFTRKRRRLLILFMITIKVELTTKKAVKKLQLSLKLIKQNQSVTQRLISQNWSVTLTVLVKKTSTLTLILMNQLTLLFIRLKLTPVFFFINKVCQGSEYGPVVIIQLLRVGNMPG